MKNNTKNTGHISFESKVINNIKDKFNETFKKLFDCDIKFIITKCSSTEILGLFFKENLDFKLPFSYKNGEISIEVFFDLRFDMNIEKKYDILNLINCKVYDEYSFLEYVDNLKNFFNKKVNNLLSFLINNCYFYKSFKENTNGKSAFIKIVIKENYYVYDCGVNHYINIDNNCLCVKINIDKNFLSFEQSPFASEWLTHSEEEPLDLLLLLINKYYNLDILKIDINQFNNIKHIYDFADIIDITQKTQNLIKY